MLLSMYASKRGRNTSDQLLVYTAGGPANYVLHPLKGITICLFFNLPGLQKEYFLRQILPSDLRLDMDTYEWKQTKI